jgi:hypothetical protein
MDKSVELFYKPPKDKYFEELKLSCIRFWRSFDEVDYVDEKIGRINDLKNEGSNFISMIQMIHPTSRKLISNILSLDTRNQISMRLYGWEETNEFDPFNIWNIDNNINDE